MDGLLRSQEQLEIEQRGEVLFQGAYNLSSNVVLFPVRHHSPACSWHLIQLLDKYQPDVILLEGPENAQELIPFAASEKTKAPFCMYVSFDDKDGKISEEKEKYRAYYPFLDFSPELVALREGAKRQIPCRFIDLSYGEKLLNTSKPPKEEEQALQDSNFLLGTYHEEMTKKLGCQSFSEAWEMLFEINGVHIDTDTFVKNVFYYCYYTRMHTPEEEFAFCGDIARETTMENHIKKACTEFSKVLVVTGGMHTVALAQRLLEDGKREKITHFKKDSSSNYLMPYSFEESDRNTGYESGMVFPFFYQKVWDNLGKKKLPFEDAVLRFIINTARTIRKKQPLSIADEIQSFYMAKGLAQLREKQECGVFEAIDAVKSSFVKGEINAQYQPALKTLFRLMSGMEMGEVDPEAGVPPIVNDFSELCKKFKVQTSTTLKKETKLDINNNPAHREKSYFFNQMEFLNTGFCQCISGRDDQQKGNRILLRETWEYRFITGVQVALISVSAFGGTIRQAAFALLSKEIKDTHNNTSKIADLLVRANRMGLEEVYGALMERLREVIGDDMDFFSVAEGFEKLCSVKKNRELLDIKPILALEDTLQLCLDRLMTLMYTIVQIKKDEEDRACKSLKFLYSYFVDEDMAENEDVFLQRMASIHGEVQANGALAGVSAGVLYKKEKLSVDEVIEKFQSYIGGSPEAKKLSASFLKGFFKIAKDVVFVDDRLLLALDKILQETSGNLFLEILPDLRLAFTDFMLYETDKIAERVASLYQVSAETLLNKKAVNQKDLEMAAELDLYCQRTMEDWLLP